MPTCKIDSFCFDFIDSFTNKRMKFYPMEEEMNAINSVQANNFPNMINPNSFFSSIQLNNHVNLPTTSSKVSQEPTSKVDSVIKFDNTFLNDASLLETPSPNFEPVPHFLPIQLEHSAKTSNNKLNFNLDIISKNGIYSSSNLIHSMNVSKEMGMQNKVAPLISFPSKEAAIPVLDEDKKEGSMSSALCSNGISIMPAAMSSFSNEDELTPNSMAANFEIEKEFNLVEQLVEESFNNGLVGEPALLLNPSFGLNTEPNFNTFNRADSNPSVDISHLYNTSEPCLRYLSYNHDPSVNHLWSQSMSGNLSTHINPVHRGFGTSHREHPLSETNTKNFLTKPIGSGLTTHMFPQSKTSATGSNMFTIPYFNVNALAMPPFPESLMYEDCCPENSIMNFESPQMDGLDRTLDAPSSCFVNPLDIIQKEEGLFEVLNNFQRGTNKPNISFLNCLQSPEIFENTPSGAFENTPSGAFGITQNGFVGAPVSTRHNIEAETSGLVSKTNIYGITNQVWNRSSDMVCSVNHNQNEAKGVDISVKQNQESKTFQSANLSIKQNQEFKSTPIPGDDMIQVSSKKRGKGNASDEFSNEIKGEGIEKHVLFTLDQPKKKEMITSALNFDIKLDNLKKNAGIEVENGFNSQKNTKNIRISSPFDQSSLKSPNVNVLKRKYTKSSSTNKVTESKPKTKQIELKIRKEGVAERITLLRQLVAPHLLKGDTSTVLGLAVDHLQHLYTEICEKMDIDLEMKNNGNAPKNDESDKSPNLRLFQKNVCLFPKSLLQWI